MVKYFSTCCLMLVVVVVCSAQQKAQKQPPPTAQQQRITTIINELPQQIKGMDEPALRVFFRMQVATFLWADKSSKASGEAEHLATEALADLADHESEVPEMYAHSFRQDLLALLEMNAPSLAASLAKQYGTGRKEDQVAEANALLRQKNGVGAAVDKMQSFLSSGGDPKFMMIFFLQHLEAEKPTEVPKLLAELLSTEEHKPSSISLETLVVLKHQFMKDERPPDLKARFIVVFIKAAQGILNQPSPEPQQMMFAHGALSDLLPAIQQLLPSLYPQASTLTGMLATRVPKSLLDQEAVEERIRGSSDPLGQTITEAEAANDSSLRESLLTQAAQLALRDGKLAMAVDLITRTESKESIRLAYRDQFLDDVAAAALSHGDTDTADMAASKINSPFIRSLALQSITIHAFNAGDAARARESLDEAFQLVRTADNGSLRTSLLLDLTDLFSRINDQRLPEVTQTTVKALNDLPTPKSEDKPGSAARDGYVRMMLQIAQRVIPAFRSLARRDEIGTINLTDSIRSKEIRPLAVFAVSSLSRKSNADAGWMSSADKEKSRP